MEGYTLGYLKDEPDKKTGTGESPAVEHIKEMIDAGLFTSDNKSDMSWILALFMLIFCFPKNREGSEYWRGKYEALKEVFDKGED